MKRIQSACLEETSCFESEADFSEYVSKLDRKGAKYEVVSSETKSDGTVVAKMKMQYLKYDTGEYIA